MPAVASGGEVRCPGCGLVLPRDPEAPAAERLGASAECFAAYGRLSAWTLVLGDAAFVHQHAVDAYAAQHPGPPAKAITVAFALVGLYLAVEEGASGREVQRAHMALARRRRAWPHFTPPAPDWDTSVATVLAVEAGPDRERMIHAWVRSVWAGWAAEHDAVIALARLAR